MARSTVRRVCEVSDQLRTVTHFSRNASPKRPTRPFRPLPVTHCLRR